MFLVSVLRYALFVLVPLSFLLSTYLYLYPVFHLCAFPSPEQNGREEYLNTLRQHTPFPPHDTKNLAPFRLLTFGDPQLEGDSSIPDVESASYPNFFKFWEDTFRTKHSPLQRLRYGLHDLIEFYLDDIPKALFVYWKRIDHVGNDYYLGHIYRTLHWWTNPTHVTVLGDLIGSQWIDDEEYERRAWRYWQRVFRGGMKVSQELASQPSDDFQDALILGEDAEAWKKRIINVAGNHDIGYAGDLSQPRMARFTRLFGKANYELRFQLPANATAAREKVEGGVEASGEKPVPEIRIIVMNDMNLDTPASSKELQDETYNFLNTVITSSHDVNRAGLFTLVLAHIPMFKKAGVCFDGPFFDFFDGEFNYGVKEQNHLSMDASKGFLEGIFGMSGDSYVAGQGFGRNGVLMAGHDHEGCDVYHYINQSAPPEREWKTAKWNDAVSSKLVEEHDVPGVREITVRSMMGDFNGNAGLFSLWFDEEEWEWNFEFVNCRLGTQHIWWVVHILDLITVVVGIVFAGMVVVENFSVPSKGKRDIKVLVNGKAKGSGKEKAKAPGAHTDTADTPDADALKAIEVDGLNGKLNIPGAGKKSLRKKRSKTFGVTPNGSASPDS